MSRFEGYICPVCMKKFTKNDDIAVCPECGTPHHRECYLKNGKCAMEGIHADYEWNGELPQSFMQGVETEKQPDSGTTRDAAFAETASESEEAPDKTTGGDDPTDETASEGDRSPDKISLDINSLTDEEQDALFLKLISPYMGSLYDWASRSNDEPPETPLDSEVQSELRKIFDINFVYDGYDVNDLPGSENMMHDILSSRKKGRDGVSMLELTFFTGVSLAHYVVPFVKFMRSTRKNGFNLSSGLFMGIHQFFRKMDGWGLLMILLDAAIEATPRILFEYGVLPSSVLGGVMIGARLLSFVPVFLMCFFGDKLYYDHAVRRIHKIRRCFRGKTDTVEYYLAIKDAGGISLVRSIFGLLVLVFSFVLANFLPSILV